MLHSTHKARTLAILDGFGSGLFAVVGPGRGVGEVGSGIGIVAVLAASVRDSADATRRWTFSKHIRRLISVGGRACSNSTTNRVDLNHVEAWHGLRKPHVLARKRREPRVATRPGRRRARQAERVPPGSSA